MVQEWIADCYEKIGPDDELIMLGDMVITLDDLVILTKLPKCKLVTLVLGDKEKALGWDNLVDTCFELGIIDFFIETSASRVNDRVFYFAHEPTVCIDGAGDRPAICGHVHGIWRTARMPNGQPIINVGIDAWGGLVSEEMIAHQYDCVTKGYYDINCFPQDWGAVKATD